MACPKFKMLFYSNTFWQDVAMSFLSHHFYKITQYKRNRTVQQLIEFNSLSEPDES